MNALWNKNCIFRGLLWALDCGSPCKMFTFSPHFKHISRCLHLVLTASIPLNGTTQRLTSAPAGAYLMKQKLWFSYEIISEQNFICISSSHMSYTRFKRVQGFLVILIPNIHFKCLQRPHKWFCFRFCSNYKEGKRTLQKCLLWQSSGVPVPATLTPTQQLTSCQLHRVKTEGWSVFFLLCSARQPTVPPLPLAVISKSLMFFVLPASMHSSLCSAETPFR